MGYNPQDQVNKVKEVIKTLVTKPLVNMRSLRYSRCDGSARRSDRIKRWSRKQMA